MSSHEQARKKALEEGLEMRSLFWPNPGRFDTDGNEWFRTDGTDVWYRWEVKADSTELVTRSKPKWRKKEKEKIMADKTVPIPGIPDEYVPIPESANLVIPWPHTRPFDISVTAAGLKDAWESIIPGLDGGGPQSIETRILMGVLRAVYDGMHGITRDAAPPVKAISAVLKLADQSEGKGRILQSIPEMKLVGNAYTGMAQRIRTAVATGEVASDG